MHQQSWVDPKEAMVNLDGLASMAKKLNDYSYNDGNNGNNGTSDKSNRQWIDDSQVNMDIDERNITSNESRIGTPNKRSRNLIDGDIGALQSPKNRRTRGVFGNKDQIGRGPFVIHNQSYHHRNGTNETRNQNQHHKQHSKDLDNANKDFFHYNINEQSLAYAIDTHLPPIVIECRPKVQSKEIATKLIMLFFKEIEKDFRQQNPNHKRPLGFDHWWQNADGTHIFGEVKDIDLFIYLCDSKRYPTNLESINIIPDPPKRLPPQNTVVIKFVKNDIEIDELRDTIKEKYKSVFTVENMMGAMRSNNRHIRVDFGDKKEYESILNSGVIGLQGQLFEVDEYLPAPKILICSKCNEPGHIKKQCQSSYEKCRRCGGNRNDDQDHKLCQIKCQHCGHSEHCANDYRCPSLLDFRRKIISELRKRPNCLPAQVHFFIPVDCRPVGNASRILTNSGSRVQERNFLPQSNKVLVNEWPCLPVNTAAQLNSIGSNIGKEGTFEQTIKSFSNEIAELKRKYLEDQLKIEQRYQEQLKNIQNGWLAIQNQISTQNEMITTTCSLIEDILFDSCITLTEMVGSLVNDIRSKTTTEEEKIRFESMDEHVKLMTSKILNKKQSFYHFQEQLNSLMSQQRIAAISTMNSLFSTNNV